MKFTGIILKESLRDEGVLAQVTVAKTETWQVQNPADFQPPVWTALFVEGDTARADDFMEALCWAMKTRSRWYADFHSDERTWIVYPGRVFAYRRGDAAGRAEAQEYGRSIGIPERQLDWGE